jgi:hypothetical protein
MRRFLFPIWEELGVEQPTPEQARRYMLTHGWTEQPYGPELFVFEKSIDGADKPMIQVLPSSAEMSSYPQRLLDLLGALCRLEDRLIRHILADMLAPEGYCVAPQVVSANDAPKQKTRRPGRRRA